MTVLWLIASVAFSFCVLSITSRLFELFPFMSPSKFWWIKYVPLFGAGFFFIAISAGATFVSILALLAIIGAGIAGPLLASDKKNAPTTQYPTRSS